MFRSTFIFCSLSTWITGIYSLAVENRFSATIISAILSGSVFLFDMLNKNSFFGTTYLVLILVHATVFANTIFGIWKNTRKSKIFFATAQKHERGTKEYRLNIRRWNNHKFDMKKVYFVFFKCFAFLSYLLVVKSLTSDGSGNSENWEIKALFITTEILIRVPIALFWYYEFKSIGENSEYIYGQKASIFKIVEGIFEPRIFKFYGNKTPTDGVHNEDNFKNDM